MTGVQKGKPSGNDKNEKSKSKKISVHIGVFFDGTGNSMMNVKERKTYDRSGEINDLRDKYYKENDSHLNDYSNVVAQYMMYKTDCAKHRYSIYIEGIGTAPRPVDLKEEFQATVGYFSKKGAYNDSTIGQGLGYGDYGVNGKIERGVQKIKACLLEIKNKEPEEVEFKLTLDVFGFSRGAAAARSFSSRIKSPKGDTYRFTSTEVAYALTNQSVSMSMYNSVLYQKMVDESFYKVCLNDELKICDIKLSEPIKVKFLGLYDTVSSYGLNFDDDVNELALTIDKSIVEDVYQICAADEYRKNFSLTLVDPLGKNIIIPGAHSDVGGGYSEKDENFVLYEKDYATIRAMNMALNPTAILTNPFLKSVVYAGNKTKEELLTGGWYTEENVKKGSRFIKNDYSCIALTMMVKKCGSSKFAMQERWNIEKKGIVCRFYNEIKSKVYYKFEGAAKKRKIKRIVSEVTPLEKKIRNQYLHLSAQGENLAKAWLSPDTISKPRFVNAAQPGNVRKIIENK